MFWEIPGIYFLFVKGKWNPVPGGQSAVTPRSEASVWRPHLSSGCRKKKLRRHGNIIQRWRKLSSSFQLIWLTFGWEETNKQNISFCQTKGLSPWSSKQTRSWTLCVRAVKQVQWISLVKPQFFTVFILELKSCFCSVLKGRQWTRRSCSLLPHIVPHPCCKFLKMTKFCFVNNNNNSKSFFFSSQKFFADSYKYLHVILYPYFYL